MKLPSISSAMGLFFLCTACLGAAEDRPPNIIIIFADDLGYGDLGCYGAADFQTPHLDRMAAEGMRFTDFHVAASVCSASRAALLTGRYPVRTGVTGVISANTRRALPLDEVTLAERFKTLGYATAIFGKWHLGNTPDAWPLQQGFDEWLGTVGSNDMGRGKPSLELRRAGKAGVELVEGEKVTETNPDQRLLTQRYTERAVDFIERKKTGSFFLYVPHNMPHTPLFASKRYAGSTERGLFGDVIAEIDGSVGQILAAVDRAGIDEHTLVMFTSDNGPWLIFGDHGGSAGPLSGGKKQTLEGGFRVPMIVRWPGRISTGETCADLVSTLDVTPTLLALAGSSKPLADIDGRDVSSLWLGGDDASDFDQPFFYFWERELRAIRHGKWKLQLAHNDTQSPDPDAIGNAGLRGEVTSVERPQALYNLAVDPGEITDLSQSHPQMVARLAAFIPQGRKIAKPSLK